MVFANEFVVLSFDGFPVVRFRLIELEHAKVLDEPQLLLVVCEVAEGEAPVSNLAPWPA